MDDVWSVFWMCSVVAAVAFTAVMALGAITYLGSALGLAFM